MNEAVQDGDPKLPPLAGVKVVEFAHVIAGPLAGTLLADLGAEVIHVEDPNGGDPSRRMGPTKEGVPLWWKVSARNKRSVTLNLRSSVGIELAHRLVARADVVITNFRADTLASWRLDWATLHGLNPKLVMLQISGYGANTTARNTPGFGKVGEAMSGVVEITGFPDGPPIHTGVSHADSVTALMGAFAISAALNMRGRNDFHGEWIDLALFETLFRLIEWQVIVFDQLGVVPHRVGNRPAIAPAAVVGTYLTADAQWLTVTSATPRSVQNVAVLLELPPQEFRTVEQQHARREQLDELLTNWIGSRSLDECLQKMAECEVVASKIFSMADIATDPTYAERGDILTVEDPDLGVIRMQTVVPRMAEHRGRVWRGGPALGQDNALVYGSYLGIPQAELDSYREMGVI
jgi:crotonobetainyl-CoA:carnitine CoA-transferase CaiB-like acyl-CoA transferase